MEILFHLTKPQDLHPLYKMPVSFELFPYKEGVFLDTILDDFKEFLGDFSSYLLDTEPKQLMTRYKDTFVYHFETDSEFLKLFLYATQQIARGKHHQFLWVRTNHIIQNFGFFARELRLILNDPFFHGSSLYFLSPKDKGYPLFELDKQIYAISDQAIFTQRKYNGHHNNAFAEPSQILFDLNHIYQFFADEQNPWNILFFKAIDIWQDTHFSYDLMKHILEQLKNIAFGSFLQELEGSLCVPMKLDNLYFANFNDLLEQFANEDHNFVQGNTKLINIHNSIIINDSENFLELSNQEDMLVLAKDKEIRITKK